MGQGLGTTQQGMMAAVQPQLRKLLQQMTGSLTGRPEFPTMLEQLFGQASPTAGQDGKLPNFTLIQPSHTSMANFSPGVSPPGITQRKKRRL